MPVRHLLLDADGVLQRPRSGWDERLAGLLDGRGREFLERAWVEERPALEGRGDFLDALGGVLAEFGVEADAESVHRAVWRDIETSEASLALVRAARSAGYGVHLATNQERHRAAHMRTVLGFDDLFDVSCYSHELGHAKPAPAYFEAALHRIGIGPEEALFVDDRADNVAAARGVGLHGVHWHLDEGHDALYAALAAHGVELSI